MNIRDSTFEAEQACGSCPVLQQRILYSINRLCCSFVSYTNLIWVRIRSYISALCIPESPPLRASARSFLLARRFAPEEDGAVHTVTGA